MRSPQTSAWNKAILQPAQEFGPVPLEILAGAIPSGLRGSLYRNGPALLQRGGQSVGHWFDGDGGILAIHFAENHATGLYRYVQTDGLRQEAQAGHYLFAGYGMVPPGPIWNRVTKPVKNVANTSVLAVRDRLLALWEAGYPHALDLETLETRGLDDLGGLDGRSFSAHPKRDPATGAIYNFGVSLSAKSHLNLFRCDATGKLQQSEQVPLKGVPLVHDCAIAGRYLVFCVPPVQINGLAVLLGLKSFKDAMQWQPERGTEILVVDRETLQVISRTTTDPWFQWHFGNGAELPDGSVVIDVARYEDFQTNQRLTEIITGQMHTIATATFWRLRLHPQTGQIIAMEQLLNRSCEFPVNPPQEVGQPSRYTYLSLHRSTTNVQTEVFDTIARFDSETGDLVEANLGDRLYPNEPIYAPDVENPQQGWILTVLYNSVSDRSEVWIWDAAQLDAEPTCRLRLPHLVPLGFHGTWNAAIGRT